MNDVSEPIAAGICTCILPRFLLYYMLVNFKVTAPSRWSVKTMYDKNQKRRREDSNPVRELAEDMIEGRNALTEALKSGRTIDKVFVAEGDTDKALARLTAMAKEAGAVVVATDRRKLDMMSPTGAHQGIMAQMAAEEMGRVRMTPTTTLTSTPISKGCRSVAVLTK